MTTRNTSTGVTDPNLNIRPGAAQTVTQSESMRTVVEILRIMVAQFSETVQDVDDEQVAEQLLNLMTYLDTQMANEA